MIADIVKRLEALLSEFDALAEACGSPDALEDLNAEFEDTLMMLSDLDPREEGREEELSDILEDLRALAGDYRALTGEIPGAEALAARLEQVTDE